MSYRITQPVNPGTQYSIPLKQGANASVVIVWNSTPFDTDYSGPGEVGTSVIVAGTGMKYNADDYQSGVITLLPINNNNVNGTGVININVYNVGDKVPEGTFPVAIPVQVVQAVVTSASTLSNENSSLGTKIIDIGVVGNADLFDVFNDHFLWKILQSGVVHNVLQGQTSGNPLLIGQSGDTSEVQGSLQIDQNIKLTTAMTSIPATGAGTGTVTFVQIATGPSWKYVIMFQSNFKNGASLIDWSLPVPFTTTTKITAAGVGGFTVLSGGARQNISVISLGNSSTAGTQGGIGTGLMQGNNIGTWQGAWDAIEVGNNYGNTHTDWAIFEGY